jgi:hypothetical protein
MAPTLEGVVWEEAVVLFGDVAARGGTLSWGDFERTWMRVVRRVVFGDAARDDTELTTMIERLRADANWAFFKPKDTALRRRFFDRMNDHLMRAEPGSLAARMHRTATNDVTEPLDQVPQWLFAFDPAGMTTFRSLALIATHPVQEAAVRDELRRTQDGDTDARTLPYLRACVLESLRLYPTTPLVLRQSTAGTTWPRGVMPAGTEVLIFAQFFHRDRRHRSDADAFAPENWLEERTREDWPFIPFSGGPVVCPGQNLVLLLTSTMLRALLAERRWRLLGPPRLDPARPLPYTLDNYSLRFRLEV